MQFLEIMPASVRVAGAGFDVSTARLDQLLLSVGARTGQILQSGLIGTVHSDTNTANPKYSASISYGPFESVPDIMLWGVYDTGYYQVCPVFYSMIASTVPPECDANHRWIVDLRTDGANIVAVRTNNDPNKTKPVHFISWTLYRKPLAG